MTTAPLDDVLTTDLHVEPGRCHVRLRGELDGCSCPQLAAALDQALSACGAVALVVVDLRRVTFCDLDGLRALESARRAARLRGVDLRCEGSTRLLRRVARIVGLDDLLGGGG